MKIYIALVQDRHTDAVLKAFRDRDAAVSWTRKEFAECVAAPERILDRAFEGFELNLLYGDDGDYAYVVESELE